MLGKRLKLARAGAGFTLRELSNKIGNLVTPQAIGKYENDQMLPGSKVLIALARALNVSVNYLVRESSIKLEGVEFRKDSGLSPKEEALVEASVLTSVERYLSVENLVGAASIKWKQPQGFPVPVREVTEAEIAAVNLRTAWNLGSDPIPNFVEFLEEKGIKVLTLSLEQKLSGMMVKVQQHEGSDVPVIILNTEDTGERQRFTLAHEIGHLLLNASKDIAEKAANRFAGAFLMPADTLREEVGKHRQDISLGELFQLKAIYGVSVQAITYRCKDLGIINPSLYKHLFDEFEAQGWRCPPYKEPQPLEQIHSTRFKRLCFRALAEDVISEAKAAELLDTSVQQLNQELDYLPVLQVA